MDADNTIQIHHEVELLKLQKELQIILKKIRKENDSIEQCKNDIINFQSQAFIRIHASMDRLDQLREELRLIMEEFLLSKKFTKAEKKN